jgi:hypothetical protein
MNGQQSSYLHHLFVLLVIITGRSLPVIDIARYRRKISANRTGRRNSADDRMPVTKKPVRKYFPEELPVCGFAGQIKNENMKFSFWLHLNRASADY